MNWKIEKYFVYQGKRYYEGTIVEFDSTGWENAKYGEYGGTNNLFTVIKSPTERFCNDRCKVFADSEHHIIRIVKAVERESDIEMIKAYKDTECSDMLYAWIFYIVSMIAATLLYDRVMAWILLSLWFWPYRRSKLYIPKRTYESLKRKGWW